MKIKIADLPLNVIDGLDRIFTLYPTLAPLASGFVAGLLGSSVFFGEWLALGAGACLIVAALVASYFVGHK